MKVSKVWNYNMLYGASRIHGEFHTQVNSFVHQNV